MLLRGRPVALCLATAILASLCLLTPPGVHAWQEQNAEDTLSDKNRSFSADAGHGSVTFGLNYYQNSDNGDGNPFLDEALTDIEPVIIFDYNVTDRLSINGDFSYDYVSSASIDRLSNYGAQSGATGDNYYGASLGGAYKLSPVLRLGGNLSFSGEYDYTSVGFSSFIARDLNNKNTTLKLNLNGFQDTIDIIRWNGRQREGTDERKTLSLTGNWYQIITPSTHSELGFSATHQSGFLETAYNFVVIEDPDGDDLSTGRPDWLDQAGTGEIVREELPDTRSRGTIFDRVRTSLTPATAVELGGRLYSDSWGISSFTIEPRLYYWLIEDKLSARLRYRFYAQTGADDYSEHFNLDTPEFRTQDSDLGDFTANGTGIKLSWYISETLRFDLSGDYIQRSDGIDQILGAVAFNWSF
ncbi:MAG: DUF3570 domain-containing protein [Planctomycetota bacterium]